MLSNLDSKFKEFGEGFTAPLRALQLLLDHPKLLTLFVLPMFITLAVVAGLIYALLVGAWSYAHQFFLTSMGTYAGALSGTLTAIIGLILLYFAFQTLSFVIAFVSSPFNDMLAEETERACGEQSMTINVQTLFRLFFLDLRKTILAILLLAFLTALGFIPFLGLLTYLGLSLINAFIYIAYPLSRRKQGIRSSLLWMRGNFFRSLGFGVATSILFTIPVLNFFALPLSVIGGTLVYLRK